MQASEQLQAGMPGWKPAIWMMIVGLMFLLLFVGWRIDASIDAMPVCVSVPTNPPPQLAAALGEQNNWSVPVPYSAVTNKPVTVAEILEIKRAIPRLQTVGRLYRPYCIDIGSPTNAVAEFWRRRKPLSVFLVRSDGIWKVESIASGIAHFSTPPDLLDRISDRTP